MAIVRITSAEGGSWTRSLPPGSTVLGRHEACGLILGHPQVSRRHAELLVDGDAVRVRDLGSHNGTWLDGQRLDGTRRLAPGQTLRLGVFSVELVAPTQPETGEVPWLDGPSEEVAIVEGGAVEGDAVLRDAFTGNPLLGRLREIGALIEGADPSPVSTFVPRFDAVSLFSEIGELLHQAPSLQSFLSEVVGLASEAVGAETGAVLLVEDDGALSPVALRSRGSVRANEVPISRTVVSAALRERAAVSSHDATKDARFEDKESITLLGLRSVLCVPLLRGDEAPGVLYLTREPGGFSREEQMTVAAIAHLAALGVERARLREEAAREERLRRALSRFHAPDVVEGVIARAAEQDRLDPHLEQAEATVVFCDIVGFTALAERASPDRLGELLNAFYRTMTEVVFDLGGTVDKYIGDCVMALFGVPIHRGDDASRGVEAALRMRARFHDLRDTEWGWAGETLDVRVGVNTGAVLAGTVGSELRLEYTALGDAVNVAQRLESTARPGQILIGPGTFEAVRDGWHVHPIGEVGLKGRARPVRIYELLGRRR